MPDVGLGVSDKQFGIGSSESAGRVPRCELIESDPHLIHDIVEGLEFVRK